MSVRTSHVCMNTAWCMLFMFKLCYSWSYIDIMVGFLPVEYTTSERDGDVSLCVHVLNAGGAVSPFSVVLLPEEGEYKNIILLFKAM